MEPWLIATGGGMLFGWGLTSTISYFWFRTLQNKWKKHLKEERERAMSEPVLKITKEKELQTMLNIMSKDLTLKTDTLFWLQKRLLGTTQRIKKLKPPIAILLRPWNIAEVHQEIVGERWQIPPIRQQEDDAEDNIVHLDQKSLYHLQFGNDSIPMYVIRDGDAMPVGADPKVFSKLINHMVRMTMVTVQEFKDRLQAVKKRALGEMWWKIGLGIAVIIIAFMFYRAVIPATPEPTIIYQTTSTAIENITGGFS